MKHGLWMLKLKKSPYLRHIRIGEAQITKRLDIFLILETLLEENLKLRKFIPFGADSYHNPIVFKLEVLTQTPSHPPIPFKLNTT